MVQKPSSSRKSQWLAFVLAVCAAVILGGLIAPEGRSQAPATMTSNAALNGLIAKVKTQQDQMAANQTKIEAQTAQLQEALRQAKLYSARSGSGHR